MHKVLYLDTNSFLQLRDLKDLAWTELIPGVKAVDLVVARAVIDELDKHKVGTNQRRRDRSRAALRLIDAASEAESRSIVLREAPVRVVLSIAPRRRVDYESLGLDAAEPDDRLVGAAATHEGAEIMSHDSGPRVTARDLSILAHSPPEGWLLPPERSDDQRKLAEAERRIKQLQDAKADVRIEVLGAEDDGKVVARRLIPPPLPPAVANRLTARLIRLHPPVDLPSAGTGLNAQLRLAGGQAFGEPTIRRYYEDRNQWELEVQRWTSILDRHVARRTSEVKVRFGLDNVGASSAENLIVELETDEELSLLADDEDADGLLGSLTPPSPPEPPKVRPSFDITDVGLSLAQPVPRRDPTAMSWIDRPRFGASRASYGCEDFRPGRKYEDVALAFRSTEAGGGLVRIEASANHMPARAVEVQIRFEDASVEWTDERVLAALPPDVAEAVRAEFS